SVKEVWAEALADYSVDEIKHGIDACLTRDWPPTLPEFLKLCRPALDYERAFVEAVEQLRRRDQDADHWSSPAVYWAATKIGAFDMSAMRYDQIKARWAKAIDEARGEIRAGALPNEVPKRLVALPAPGETTVPPEEAQRRLA